MIFVLVFYNYEQAFKKEVYSERNYLKIVLNLNSTSLTMPTPAVLGFHDLGMSCAILNSDEVHHDEKTIFSDN